MIFKKTNRPYDGDVIVTRVDGKLVYRIDVNLPPEDMWKQKDWLLRVVLDKESSRD